MIEGRMPESVCDPTAPVKELCSHDIELGLDV